MCDEDNKKIADFLKIRFDEAQAREAKLAAEEQKPLTVCAIMTDEGSIFASISSNVASHDNIEGSSPLEEALEGLNLHKRRIKTDFNITVVAVTTSVDPESSELIPIDWSYFGREKRMLEEAGVNEVLHICPDTDRQMVLSL